MDFEFVAIPGKGQLNLLVHGFELIYCAAPVRTREEVLVQVGNYLEDVVALDQGRILLNANVEYRRSVQRKVDGLEPLGLCLGLLLVSVVPIGINVAVELVDYFLELLFDGGRLDAVEFFLGERPRLLAVMGLLARLIVRPVEEADGKVSSIVGGPLPAISSRRPWQCR